MANEYSSVDCSEVPNTRDESYDTQGNFTASVRLHCTAANKDALIADILGNQRVWPNSTFTRRPFAHKISGLEIKDLDTTVDLTARQNYAVKSYEMNVEYTTAPEKQLVAVTLEPVVDVIKLDHRLYRWSGGAPLTQGEAPGLIRPRLAIKRQVFGASAIPTALIDHPGAVHNASYVDPDYGRTWAEETLLLKPEPITTKLTTAGLDGYNFTVMFLYNPQGWNKYFKTDTGLYEEIVNASGTVIKNFPPQNLSSLLS